MPCRGWASVGSNKREMVGYGSRLVRAGQNRVHPVSSAAPAQWDAGLECYWKHRTSQGICSGAHAMWSRYGGCSAADCRLRL